MHIFYMPNQKKHSIDVLVEGSNGELVFQSVEATKSDFKKLAETTKNPVIAFNLKKSAKDKGVRL